MSWECVGVPWKCEPSIHQQLSFYWPRQSLSMLCITEIVCFSKRCSFPGLCLALYWSLHKVLPCKCHVNMMESIVYSLIFCWSCHHYSFSADWNKGFWLPWSRYMLCRQLLSIIINWSKRSLVCWKNLISWWKFSIIALSISTCQKTCEPLIGEFNMSSCVCHVLAAGGEYISYLNATIQREPQGNYISFPLGNLTACWPESQNFILNTLHTAAHDWV